MRAGRPAPRLLAALTAAALALTACSALAPADDGVFRVGLVTDVGEVDDAGFNQSAWEGAQQGAAAVGGVADYIETLDAKDYADHIARFADQNYEVIVTVGFELGPATVAAARKYPRIKFIGVDQFQAETIPNLTGLIFPEDRAGYLAGVLAASLTRTGVIAAVLGTDLVPPVVAFKEGYEAGARATRRNIKIISTYHPGSADIAFTEPQWGARTAAQAIDQGADVVFAAGGKTGNGALLQTSILAQENPGSLYCIGVDTDQWFTMPDARPCLVSSAMKLITPSVAELIRLAQAGQFPGGNYIGEVGLAPYHAFDGLVPVRVQQLILDTARKLESGELQTGYQP